MFYFKGEILMSFLKYQKQSPEFLTNFLKYKRFIEFKAETTTDELYFDLRTLLRYIKLFLSIGYIIAAFVGYFYFG